MQKKYIEINYSLLMGGHFAVMAVMSFAVTLLRSHDVSNENIGIILAMPPLLSIVIQEMLGRMSDKYPNRCSVRKIILILLISTLISFLMLAMGQYQFVTLLIAFSLLGSGIYSLSPFYSSMAIQYEKQGMRVRYSLARGIGSLTYGVMSCLMGIIVQHYNVNFIIVMGICFLFSMIYIAYGMPVSQQPEIKKINNNMERYPIAYVLFLMASFFLFFGHFILNTYMIDVVEYLGGSNSHVGYTQLLLSLSEIPVAIFFLRLKQRFGLNKIILFCGSFMFLKIIGNAMAQSLGMLMIIQLLQGLGNGLYWAASVLYVDKLVEEHNRVRSQSLLFIACSGISGFSANLVGGKILNYASLAVLKNAAVISGIFGILFIILSVSKNKEV